MGEMITACTAFAGKPRGKREGYICRLVFYLRQLPYSDAIGIRILPILTTARCLIVIKVPVKSDMLSAQVRMHSVFKNGGKRHGMVAYFVMVDIRCTHVVSGKRL